MTRALIEMTGTYGSLTIIERDPHSPGGSEARWLCSCVCGRTVSRYGATLRSGETTSCGCTYVQGRSSDVWDAATIEKLRRLWDSGLSTPNIAQHMGISKNAVVGKAHRLHLDPRPSPIRRSGDPKPVPSIPRERPRDTLPPMPSAMPPPAARPVFVAPVSVVEAPRPVRVRQCTYLTGDRPRDFERCGEAVVRGSYCEAHAARVYVRVRDRKEEAA